MPQGIRITVGGGHYKRRVLRNGSPIWLGSSSSSSGVFHRCLCVDGIRRGRVIDGLPKFIDVVSAVVCTAGPDIEQLIKASEVFRVFPATVSRCMIE